MPSNVPNTIAPDAERPADAIADPDTDLARQALDHVARTVFSSGLDPAVVERRWRSTREAFGGFAVREVASMDDDDVEALAHDRRVIRNRGKLRAVIDNAGRLEELLEAHGSAAAWLASLGRDDAEATGRLVATFRFVGPAGAPGLLSRLRALEPPG